MLHVVVAFVLALPAFAAGAPALDSIVWQKQWEDVQAQARAQKKVVFVAVNMDGEKANERLATKVYKEKALVALTRNTLNVVASASEHASGDKNCPRFDGIACLDHRRIDTTLRKELLKADAQGYVVAPQHVFLDPEGKVLLSVPYEVSADELAWCFVTAIKTVDPASALALPAGAKRPRLLILGAVLDPATAGGVQKPLTRAELLELLKEIKKTDFGIARAESIRAVLTSDEPEALEFIRQELRSGLNRLMGGGAGGAGGRGGGGGGLGRAGQDGANRGTLIMHGIGVFSPPAYWEVAVEFVGDNDPGMRGETAVALEQLAAPESVRALHAALQKETSPNIQKDLLRALGTAGANDKNTRSMLLKRVKSEKNGLLRLNAIVAAGSLASGDDVAAELTALLAGGVSDERTAAVCAMAMSRDERYTGALEAASKDERDADVAKTAATALEIVKGGPLRPIRDTLKRVCQDTIDRERFFGKADK